MSVLAIFQSLHKTRQKRPDQAQKQPPMIQYVPVGAAGAHRSAGAVYSGGGIGVAGRGRGKSQG